MELPQLPQWPDFLPSFLKKNKPKASKIYTKLSESVAKSSESKIEDVLAHMETSAKGLSHAEAAERLEKYGENRPVHTTKKSKVDRLVEAYVNPLNLLLTLLAAISYRQPTSHPQA